MITPSSASVSTEPPLSPVEALDLGYGLTESLDRLVHPLRRDLVACDSCEHD